MSVLAPDRMAAFHERYDVEPSTGCWLWTAAIGSKGYGRFKVDGKEGLAHRVAWRLLRGPIPDGLQLDHLCRTRRCVNPDHLEPVDARTNLLRGDTVNARNVAKTHCPKGHPYDDANTQPKLGGQSRACRACNRADCKRRRAALLGQVQPPA